MIRRLFIGGALAALLAPGAQAARKPLTGAEMLDRSVKAHGGMAKFSRIETVSLQFNDITRSTEEGAAATGRRFFRLHDAQGPRGHEARVESDGRRQLTVFNANGSWQWTQNDAPQNTPGAGRELQKNFNFMFLSFVVKESSCAVQYGGLGRLEGRLMSRLTIADGRCLGYGEGSSLTVYVDSGTYFVGGLAWKTGPDAVEEETVLTDNVMSSGLVVPTAHILLDPEGQTLHLSKIHDLSLNIFVDETLFKPPQAAAPHSKPATGGSQ
jgi:hypothetical protein